MCVCMLYWPNGRDGLDESVSPRRAFTAPFNTASNAIPSNPIPLFVRPCCSGLCYNNFFTTSLVVQPLFPPFAQTSRPFLGKPHGRVSQLLDVAQVRPYGAAGSPQETWSVFLLLLSQSKTCVAEAHHSNRVGRPPDSQPTHRKRSLDDPGALPEPQKQNFVLLPADHGGEPAVAADTGGESV